MWSKAYKDYKIDQPLVKNQVASGRGIIGCEMHDLNGWGEAYHQPVKKKKRGVISTLFLSILSGWDKKRQP